MITFRRPFLFLLCALFFVSTQSHANTITVPLKIYIVENLDISVKQRPLTNWVSRNELTYQVLPEINRIWAQANLQFSIASIESLNINVATNTSAHIEKISGATRNAAGKSDPERIKALDAIVSPAATQPGTIAVYVVPFLGENSQGNAKRKKRRIYITQWTNKNQSKNLPPRRFELIEKGDYSKGSFSRTLAHELGHILGLKHPDKDQQREFKRLMGGKKKGYRLINPEIRKARQAAKKLIKVK